MMEYVTVTDGESIINDGLRTPLGPIVITEDNIANIALDWIMPQVVSETLPVMKKEECEQTQCQDGNKDT